MSAFQEVDDDSDYESEPEQDRESDKAYDPNEDGENEEESEEDESDDGPDEYDDVLPKAAPQHGAVPFDEEDDDVDYGQDDHEALDSDSEMDEENDVVVGGISSHGGGLGGSSSSGATLGARKGAQTLSQTVALTEQRVKGRRKGKDGGGGASGEGGHGGKPLSQEAALLLNQANQAYQDGNVEGARKLANEIVRLNPHSIEPYGLVRLMAHDADNVAQEAEVLWIMATLSKTDADLFREAFDYAMNAGNKERALKCAERIDWLEPRDWAAMGAKARLLADFGRTRQAIDAFRGLLRKFPYSFEEYDTLCSCCPNTKAGHATAIEAMAACLGCAIGRRWLRPSLLKFVEGWNVPEYGYLDTLSNTGSGSSGGATAGGKGKGKRARLEPVAAAAAAAAAADIDVDNGAGSGGGGGGKRLTTDDVVQRAMTAAYALSERLGEYRGEWQLAHDAIDSVEDWLVELRSTARSLVEHRRYLLAADLALQDGVCLAHLKLKAQAKRRFDNVIGAMGKLRHPMAVVLLAKAARAWLDVREFAEAEGVAQAMLAAYSSRTHAAANLLLARGYLLQEDPVAAVETALKVLRQRRHADVGAAVTYLAASRELNQDGGRAVARVLGKVAPLVERIVAEETVPLAAEAAVKAARERHTAREEAWAKVREAADAAGPDEYAKEEAAAAREQEQDDRDGDGDDIVYGYSDDEEFIREDADDRTAGGGDGADGDDSGGRGGSSSGGGGSAGGDGGGAGTGSGVRVKEPRHRKWNSEASWDRLSLLLEWGTLRWMEGPKQPDCIDDFMSVAMPVAEQTLRRHRTTPALAASKAAGRGAKKAAAAAAATAATAADADEDAYSDTNAGRDAAPAAARAAVPLFSVLPSGRKWPNPFNARVAAAAEALAKCVDTFGRMSNDYFTEILASIVRTLLDWDSREEAAALVSEASKLKRVLLPPNKMYLKSVLSGHARCGGEGDYDEDSGTEGSAGGGGGGGVGGGGFGGIGGGGGRVASRAMAVEFINADPAIKALMERIASGLEPDVRLWNAAGRAVARNAAGSAEFIKYMTKRQLTMAAIKQPPGSVPPASSGRQAAPGAPAARQPPPVPGLLLSAHRHIEMKRLSHALRRYVEAFERRPHEPLVPLCLATAMLRLVGLRRAVDQHGLVLRAAACLQNYAEARLAGAAAAGVPAAALEQEALYNTGRAYHHVGLAHLAIEFYGRALRIADDRRGDLAAASGSGGGGGSGGAGADANMTMDAAYNLMVLYRNAGSLDMARAVMVRYLVVG